MQIVIELQEDDFEKIKNTSFVENTEIMFHQSSEDRKLTMMLFRIMDAIKDCTPLPKGHGRLIDAYAIPGDGSWDLADRLDEAPTIIEADTEEENANSN